MAALSAPRLVMPHVCVSVRLPLSRRAADILEDRGHIRHTGFALTTFSRWRASPRFVLGRWLGRAPLLSFGGGFSTSSFGMWSSRRCRRGELTLGWCVPAPREDFTMGWWRQASAVRYGLARRLPRGGHDLTSASWSTFTDLIPFHALFETIQLSCLLLVAFSSHGSERSPGRPRFPPFF